MGQRTSEVELGQVRVRPRAAPAWARPLLIYSLVVCKCAWRLPLCTSTCAGTHAARLRKFVTAAVSEEPEHTHGPM
jgi:hypothetical protein